MLKGHTKIELTDVNTGKVEVHEDDNMFTDGVYKTLNNTWTALVGGVSTLKSWHLPLSQKLLGGIALFEDSITEETTTDYFPEGNKTIAVAGTTASDGKTKWWGSRNSLESQGYDEETKSVKHVWDFTTSEGNGTISAVGLMDGRQGNTYGLGAWNLQYSRYLTVTSYFNSYGRNIVTFEGDNLWYITNGTGEVTINKVKFNFDKVTLNNNLGTTEVVETKNVTMPNTSMNYAAMFWMDGGDGYWYGFLPCNSGFASPYITSASNWYYVTQYLHIVRINKESFGVEYHNITTTGYYVNPMMNHPIITKNYIGFILNTSPAWYWNNTVGNLKYGILGAINKQDWTWSVKNLEDEDGNTYEFFHLGNQYDHAWWCGGGHGGVRLPNGTVQFDDLVFDDDLKVLYELKPPITASTQAPDTKPSGHTSDIHYACNYPYYSLGTTQSSTSSKLWYRILNREKNVWLLGGYGSWGSNGDGSYAAFILPADCMRLYTINNLSEPVTKTASQTMKITYTITDSE